MVENNEQLTNSKPLISIELGQKLLSEDLTPRTQQSLYFGVINHPYIDEDQFQKRVAKFFSNILNTHLLMTCLLTDDKCVTISMEYIVRQFLNSIITKNKSVSELGDEIVHSIRESFEGENKVQQFAWGTVSLQEDQVNLKCQARENIWMVGTDQPENLKIGLRNLANPKNTQSTIKLFNSIDFYAISEQFFNKWFAWLEALYNFQFGRSFIADTYEEAFSKVQTYIASQIYGCMAHMSKQKSELVSLVSVESIIQKFARTGNESLEVDYKDDLSYELEQWLREHPGKIITGWGSMELLPNGLVELIANPHEEKDLDLRPTRKKSRVRIRRSVKG